MVTIYLCLLPPFFSDLHFSFPPADEYSGYLFGDIHYINRILVF